MGNFISSYCKINSAGLWHDGKLLYESSGENTLDELYKKMDLSYPKFFKMDYLSKLGILASELLLKNHSIPGNKISIVLSNKSSSLQTDNNYLKSMESFPSPSLFVYTLPNIVTGEICIKHKITGENAFFIEQQFNAELLFSYTESLLKHSQAALCGWVESENNHFEAFLYFVEKGSESTRKSSTFMGHTTEQINTLYKQ